MNTIFDTHCHPYLNNIKDQTEVIENFFKNGGKYINIIGTNIETNKKAIEIANKYSGIFATVGIHPCDSYDLDLKETISFLEKLIVDNKEKIVGIGECGLDYYWLERPYPCPQDSPTRGSIPSPSQEKEATEIKKQKIENQKIFFRAQIELARKHNLPLIIHNRDSKDDIFDILQETGFKNFIFHCYSENLEYAEKLLKFSPDCKISFSGIVTFKNAKEIQETAKTIPLKNILAETDSPYLTPVPFRGREENEPLFTKYVVEKISELRGKDCAEIILHNSLEIFGLKK